MTSFINFRNEQFVNYFSEPTNPKKFILYCAVANRIITYINKNKFANFESFILESKDKDTFLKNSKSEFVIKNFESDDCKFTDENYVYILKYLKNILNFDVPETSISLDITNKFKKVLEKESFLIKENNGGIFNE